MRIAINALTARLGAGVTFYSHFLPALDAVDQKNEYVIILTGPQSSTFASMPARFEQRVVSRVLTNFVIRALWEQAVLPFLLRKWKIDVLYTQGNFTSLFAPCRKVVVVTGSNPYSPLKLEPLMSRMKHKLIGLASFLSARTAASVVFLSEDSREKIRRKLRLPREKTRVIYYGWTPESHRSEQSRFDYDEYILTVSILYRHKNLERLMRAFNLLVARTGYRGLLVLAGSVFSKNYYRELQAFRDTLDSRRQIVFTETVSAGELKHLYNHTKLFVFPSVEETFGIPVLEAMGAGLAIAASDCRLASEGQRCFNPFPEICADAAEYFNPFDEESIVSVLQRLLADPRRRQTLGARGRHRVTDFSWARTAEETFALFEEIGSSTDTSPSISDENATDLSNASYERRDRRGRHF